jgi:eukaryotic-like serine/threonine-protein kinase
VTPAAIDRDPIEQLAAEFMERQRHGEHPSIDDYIDRYPALAVEIRELFPTIAALEGLKQDKAAVLPPRGQAAAVPLRYLGDYRIIREIGRGCITPTSCRSSASALRTGCTTTSCS